MTKSAATVLKTEAIIFPLESASAEAEPASLKDQAENESAAARQPIKTKIENRFGRLKKSLRKRSVSIL